MIRSILAGFIFSFGLAHAAPVSVNGAGSTFAEPVYTRWMADYQKVDKDTKFNYQGIGSGAGIKQMLEGTIDFAGTDDPMKTEEVAKAKSKVIHVPIAMGAIVVTYNLPGFDNKTNLKMTGEVLAKIFNGKIKKWNAPELTSLNTGTTLPDLDIAVATRSDGSGSTAVFTEYFSKVDKEWEGKNGKSVNWFQGSLGAKGNAGVAGLVKQTPGTIGYVELVYALENGLPVASVKNTKGDFVVPTAESVSAAANGVSKEAIAKDFKISLTNSTQKSAYPISAFTWMLIYEKMPKAKGTPIVNFAKWVLGDEAQKTASTINYAPVPKEIRAAAQVALKKVKFE